MDDFFLKAADFYRDKSKHIPELAVGSWPRAAPYNFRFLKCPDFNSYGNFTPRNMYRLEFIFDGYGGKPSYNVAFVMERLPREYEQQAIEQQIKPALDAIVTEYYHDKWMEEKGDQLIKGIFNNLKTKLKKSKRSESVKRSTRRLINEFIQEWEGYVQQ